MAILVLAVSGCGRSSRRIGDIPVYPVRGSVTFADQPIEFAIVTLIPVDQVEGKKYPASQGITDALGEFVLSTYNQDDGAPEGKYYVTVSCEDRNGKRIGGEFPDLLPARYQSPLSSGLKVEIEDDENELEPLKLVK